MSGLTGGDIYRLDLFEGDEYLKEWVDVVVKVEGDERVDKDGANRGEGGIDPKEEEKRRAQTYVYIAGEDRLEEREWDYEEFRREKLGNWTGSSEEFKGMFCEVCYEIGNYCRETVVADNNLDVDNAF